ncbi:hypothetical protein Rs2_30686 [Raphanus sativus]|nr:hypothetical protein Rs2_30686 [Raphanus sativus]
MEIIGNAHRLYDRKSLRATGMTGQRAWEWENGKFADGKGTLGLPAKRLENKIGEALQQPQNCFFICVCQKKNKQKELPNQLFLQRHAWKGLDKTELGKHTHDSG